MKEEGRNVSILSNVYFRLYGDRTYILNLSSGKSYLFNEMVYDILTIIKENPGIDSDKLCYLLAEIYEVQDEHSFSLDINIFLQNLVDVGILAEGSSVREIVPSSTTPEDLLTRHCRREHLLQNVTIELTYRCNERCAHCYVGDSDKYIQEELTTQELFDLLDQLREMNVLNLTLTGGEVAVRDDFLDILRYAVKAGFLVSIFTNGIGLTEQMLDELAALPLRSVSFSLYSGNPQEHEDITGIPGSYDRTLYAMLRLGCAGVKINVKTPVMRSTLKGFEALHRMCMQFHFSHQVSYLICSTNKGCLSPTRLRVSDVEQFKRLMRISAEDSSTVNIPYRVDEEPICGAGGDCLSINPYGMVFPCNGYSIELGNVRKESVRSIWEGQKVREIYQTRFSSLKDECLRCIYKADCLYCPGAALSENGDIREKIQESCLIARAAFELRHEGSTADASE